MALTCRVLFPAFYLPLPRSPKPGLSTNLLHTSLFNRDDAKSLRPYFSLSPWNSCTSLFFFSQFLSCRSQLDPRSKDRTCRVFAVFRPSFSCISLSFSPRRIRPSPLPALSLRLTYNDIISTVPQVGRPTEGVDVPPPLKTVCSVNSEPSAFF